VGRKVDGRRKPEIGKKAEPGTGQRRKLQMSSKAKAEGLTGRRKLESQQESGAGRLNEGASWRTVEG